MWTEQATALWLEEGGPLRGCGKLQKIISIHYTYSIMLWPVVGKKNYLLLPRIKNRVSTQQKHLQAFCRRSCRISGRHCTKNTRPELLTPADPNPPQLTSSAHPQCLATTAFYWLKFCHPPSPLLSHSTGELRNLKNGRNTPMNIPNIWGPPFWGVGRPKWWSMIGDYHLIMTIIP